MKEGVFVKGNFGKIRNLQVLSEVLSEIRLECRDEDERLRVKIEYFKDVTLKDLDWIGNLEDWNVQTQGWLVKRRKTFDRFFKID